jgi:hypothetical protein
MPSYAEEYVNFKLLITLVISDSVSGSKFIVGKASVKCLFKYDIAGLTLALFILRFSAIDIKHLLKVSAASSSLILLSQFKKIFGECSLLSISVPVSISTIFQMVFTFLSEGKSKLL